MNYAFLFKPEKKAKLTLTFENWKVKKSKFFYLIVNFWMRILSIASNMWISDILNNFKENDLKFWKHKNNSLRKDWVFFII